MLIWCYWCWWFRLCCGLFLVDCGFVLHGANCLRLYALWVRICWLVVVSLVYVGLLDYLCCRYVNSVVDVSMSPIA